METEKTLSVDSMQNEQVLASFFEKDASFFFAYKKTEKLASAIYMVTNLFSDNEPMKWVLRKKISDLVSFILNYKDVPESGMSDFANNAKTRVLELVSMLEISSLGGLISKMNFSILKQEFLNLLGVFDSSDDTKRGVSFGSIPKNFFDVSDPVYVKSFYKSHTLDKQNDSRTVSSVVPKDINREDLSVPKRSNRQNIIIGLLKKKKELTIKDIALVIRDCSEKTIQRELISLISSGVIKRNGERRWSKYSLKIGE